MKKKILLIISIILFSLIPIVPSYAEESDWILEERGDNYQIFYNSTHPALKRWNSAPLWIYSGNEYMPYIFKETPQYYEVASGLIGARIYDYYAEFYSPDMEKIRLYSEMWEVQRFTNKWSDIGAQSGTPTLTVTQGETGINITKSFTSWAGELTIIYIFREGQPLKHTIYFNSILADETTYRVKQQWAGIVGDKVAHETGTDTIITATELNGASFRFLNNDDSLSIYENQWSAIEYLEPVIVETHAQGMKADFIFSNWTLAQGETLEIDPDTATLNNPTVDGYCSTSSYTKVDTGDYIRFGKWYTTGPRYARAYVEWPISSIPDYAMITNTVFKYHGKTDGVDDSKIVEMTGCRPSTSDYDTIWAYLDTANSYVDPWNPVVATGQQQDLGATADSDLEGKLDIDWFAIGFVGEELDNAGYDEFYAEEYASNPDPTLYIEYYIDPTPTIESTQITNMDDTDKLHPRLRTYLIDFDGQDLSGWQDISHVLINLTQGSTVRASFKYTNSTDSFSIINGDDKFELISASCSSSRSGNNLNLTIAFQVEYDAIQENDLELKAYIEDSYGGSDSDIKSDYCDIVTNLETTFNLDDDRGNLSQPVTASGQITFEGSNLYPSDSNFTSVSVYDSGNNNEGSDSSIVNGAWSVNFNAPSTVGTDTYNLYIDMVDSDYTDGEETSPTDSFINDRYNVTSFWASDYNPPIGDNITLYAIFESEYDSHLCDGDDSITIENLQFTYDPIEEYFFAEIGKDEDGTYYFDTLNSIYENTYEVYDGNLDYNLSVTWGGFDYEFYGLYYENGTYAGNVTVSAYFEDTIDTFTLEGWISKNYDDRSIMITWPLSGGASRVIYFINNPESNYIFTPDGEYSAYAFTIKDYTGVIGKGDSYLETMLIVNGTEYLIERPLIWDTANPVTAILQKDNRYRLQIRDGNGAVHIFDYFLPAVGVTPELIIDEIAFTEQVHYIGEYVSVEAVRPDYEHIQINYKDERAATSSIFVEICYMNQTQIWNSTSTEQYVQFNWYDAINTTDYLINLVAQHTIVDEVLYSNALAGYYEQYDDPPDLGIFGESGKYFVSVGILMLILAVADASTAKMVTTAMVGVAYILRFIGWLNVPVMGIHLSLFLVGAWWLSGRM